jgi:hypothetical protein
MTNTLHIRFNIDAVGGGAYGLACYKILVYGNDDKQSTVAFDGKTKEIVRAGTRK